MTMGVDCGSCTRATCCSPEPVPTGVLKPPVATVPWLPGAPVPPTTPLLNPAEATVPRSFPPGTPLATPEPKFVPCTDPWRAAPAPVDGPGALPKAPTAAMVG